MAKEEVSFTRNQSVDLDFFNPDEDITIIQIFLKPEMPQASYSASTNLRMGDGWTTSSTFGY